jgi:hypothetical protein
LVNWPWNKKRPPKTTQTSQVTSTKNGGGGLDSHILLIWGSLTIASIVLVLLPLLGNNIDPTYGFVLLVIFGIVSLLAVLTIAGSVYIKTSLACKEEALGLPSGSVRAIIALGLIIIFAILAIFMYNHLTPSSLVINVAANETYVFTNGTSISSPYGLHIATEATQSQRDFSTQTLSTVSTLVVALAGFYFGSKAGAPGKEEKEPEYDISIKQKSDTQQGKPLVFDVITNPKGEIIKLLSVEGDKLEAFDFKNYKDKGEITYIPTPEHANIVKAIFAVTSDSKIKSTEEIKIELEKMVVTKKPSTKIKAKEAFPFEVDFFSAEGKVPSVKIIGDAKNDKTLDTKEISQGKFSYIPSAKDPAVRPEDIVYIEVTLDGKQPITESIKVEIEP